MVATDVLGVIMVQAEAGNRGWLAGIMDAAQWGVGIATTTISVTTLDGHDFRTKVLVVAFVTVANVLGTKLGQLTGKRLLSAPRMMRLFRSEGMSTEDRIAALERAIGAKGHL